MESIVDREAPRGGCHNHCPAQSYVVVEPTATDDHTSLERIGYRLTVVAGQVPASVGIESGEIYSVDGDGLIAFHLDRDTPSFKFQLEVVAIDESENESAPVTIWVDGSLVVRVW